MKKLLLSLLTLMSINALADIPKQSIFTDTPAYDYVPVNMDKLVIANSIIHPKDQAEFYKKLLDIFWNDKKDILKLVNTHYNTSGKAITAISDIHISEILKQQQNNLIEQNRKMINYNPFMGDNMAQDSRIVLLYSIVGAGLSKCYQSTGLANVSGFFFVGSLCLLYKMYHYIRSREAHINYINKIIKAIEMMEEEELATIVENKE